ncbi:hypothetical protein ACFL35_13475 [Candidatus Riflebacteria bacterium]
MSEDKCQIQVGTLWLRDCESTKTGTCEHCGRTVCEEHTQIFHLKNYCPDCHLQAQQCGEENLPGRKGKGKYLPRQQIYYEPDHYPIYYGSYRRSYYGRRSYYRKRDYDGLNHDDMVTDDWDSEDYSEEDFDGS